MISFCGSGDENFYSTEAKLMRCLPRTQILFTSSVLAGSASTIVTNGVTEENLIKLTIGRMLSRGT
jgi:precorrin-2 methylase